MNDKKIVTTLCNSRAIALSCALLIALLLPTASHAQSNTCDLDTIAKQLAVKNQPEWVLNCYWSLRDDEKKQLFPQVIRYANISLEKITEDFRLTAANTDRPIELIPLDYRPQISRKVQGGVSTNLTSGSGAWTQWLERIPFTAYNLVNASSFWRDRYWCDGSFDPDLDAIFVYNFPSSASNPDAIRSFGSLNYPLIDLMLTYYGFGVNGSGYTWSSTVYACVGETSINWLGTAYIQNGLKLSR